MSARDVFLRLSARRRQCAELAAQGLSNREIGEALRLSEHIVAMNYLWHIYNLTGCDNEDRMSVTQVSKLPPQQLCVVCGRMAEYLEMYDKADSKAFCSIHVVKRASIAPEDRERILPEELR